VFITTVPPSAVVIALVPFTGTTTPTALVATCSAVRALPSTSVSLTSTLPRVTVAPSGAV
jgi:hypothetical protein